MTWHMRRGPVALTRPFVFGIVNVTPDSFSDGGSFATTDRALAHVERMVEKGADGIDIGGESTRPQGSVPVSAEEEIRRVVPVLAAVRARFATLPISVDTTKSEVARVALENGADVINDVSAFRLDARMGEIVAASGAGVVLMHSRGGVADMGTYRFAQYGDDIVGDVRGELNRSILAALETGVARDAIVIDPGIGFAKRSEHSLRVLAELSRLVALGFPVMIGVSRKRFVGELSRVDNPADRVAGTVAANVAGLLGGARLFRVHDVAPNRQGLDVAWGILMSNPGPTQPDPAQDVPDSRFHPPTVGGHPPESR